MNGGRSHYTDAVLPPDHTVVEPFSSISGDFLFHPLLEMKLALSRSEESQCTFQGGKQSAECRRRRAEEEKAAEVTVNCAIGALAGVSRSA